MLAPSMTPEQIAYAHDRHKHAARILADMESQYVCTIPTVWRETIPSLLLHGLTDPSLHKLMHAMLTIEHAAGRYTPQPPNYSAD